MNLAKKLRQISNNASVGWEERFEKYMTEKCERFEKYMTEKCEKAAKVGDTFIIVFETERFEGKKIGIENLRNFAAKNQLEVVEYCTCCYIVKISW